MANQEFHTYYRRRNSNNDGWDIHYFKTTGADVLDATVNGNYRGAIKGEVHKVNNKSFTSNSGITLYGSDINVSDGDTTKLSTAVASFSSNISALNTFKNTTVPNTYLPKAGGTISGNLTVSGITTLSGDATIDTANITNLTLANNSFEYGNYVYSLPEKTGTIALAADVQEITGKVNAAQSAANTALSNAADAQGRADAAYSLAEGRLRSVSFATTDDMILALKSAEKEDFRIGDNLFIEAVDVPDYWISGILDTNTGTYGYFEVSILETQKVDLRNYVTLDGAQTITGAKTFSGTAQFGAGVRFAGDITVQAGLVDKNSSKGTAGQALFSDGSKIYWSDVVTTDTKNTAGSTDTSKKIFLIGAESQAANPQTYSHNTAYVGTDGCLYSNSTKVFTEAGGDAGGVTLSGGNVTATKVMSDTLSTIDETISISVSNIANKNDVITVFTDTTDPASKAKTGDLWLSSTAI